MIDPMHEQCGVVAVVDLAGAQDVVPMTVAIAQGLQHRGELGAGLSWLDAGGEIRLLKDHGSVAEVLHEERIRTASARGNAAIAHTRYATNALLDPCMIQPFHYGCGDAPAEFSFAFNGNIANCEEQALRLAQDGNPPRIEGDTEIIGRTVIAALRRHSNAQMTRVLRELGQLDGAYNIVMLEKTGVIDAVRDRHGFHPLTFARKGSIVAVASEDSAIRRVWPDAHPQDMQPGYLLRATPEHSEISQHQLWLAEPSTCFFESVYFADHRSRIDGTSVANARYECGKILAEMDADRPMTDIVVPVPESAKIAANGYADTRRLRRVDGILKNHAIGRTFISPRDRMEKAARKYDIDADLLRGRSIILIDDSLVRGTTLRVLATQLRSQGVSEIHLRLASPAIISPCFYGIDFPTVSELLVRKHTNGVVHQNGVLPPEILVAIALDLGIESIRYLSVDAIPRALGKARDQICMACVTGQYPTPEGERLHQLAEEHQ